MRARSQPVQSLCDLHVAEFRDPVTPPIVFDQGPDPEIDLQDPPRLDARIAKPREGDLGAVRSGFALKVERCLGPARIREKAVEPANSHRD